MIIGIDASRAVVTPRTGTEAYAYHLIQSLVPLAVEAGHTLRLYFNQAPEADLLNLAAVDPVVIPQRRLWTHVRLRRELLDRPPDVFFTPAHVIPIGYGGASVATVHDLGYRYFPESHTRQQRAYLDWSTRHNAQTARRVIADSRATQVDLEHAYAIPSDKVDVIYPGADPSLAPVTDAGQLAAVAEQYGISMRYLFYLGTLQPRKNLVRLVEAFAASGLATNTEQPTMLVLAGKAGWMADDLLESVAALPPAIRAQIVLPGFVDEADKAALISGATALVFPSLYEGFGFPVLEGQACATAVLCANSSSLPEVAGDAALLVDPLDVDALTTGLQAIANNASLRALLVERGLRNLERFHWSDTAAAVLRTLEAAAA